MQKNRINGVGTGGILINADAEVLLLKRVKPPEAGCWSIPGGAIEFGETAEEAVVREFHEETGLTCEIVDFIGYYDYILQKERLHWISLFFVVSSCSCMRPENKESDKHSGMQWFPLHALPKDITGNTTRAINLYKRWIEEKRMR